MFNRFAKAAGLAGALALSAMATSALAQEVTLRVHHFLPGQATVPANFITPWAEKVMEESGGRINVEVYHAMQLGGAPGALIDQAREGIVDIVWVLPGWTPGRFPRAEVFDLPFIASDAETTSRAAWRFYEEHLAEEMADVHMIAVNVHGPGMFHMRAPVIETPDDMSGRTVRGPTRMITRLIETLGGAAVGMPVGQVPESLQRNVIDGTVIPWEVTTALRVSELVDTHTEFAGDRSFYTTFFVFAMNRDAYEDMPEDLRAVIDANSGIETSAWIGRVMEAGDAPARAVAVERGNTIVTIDGEALEAWREAAMPVHDIWIAEMAERGIDGAMLIAEVERLIDEEAAR
ncbi:MAG: TRAP transporter substrate-binding protein [Pararhodobacter sp.]